MPVSVKGRKPYNNGKICKYFYPGEQPVGWVYGLLKRTSEQIEVSNNLRKDTCRKLYNCDNIRQLKEVQDKARATAELRYGDPNYNNREKMLQTAWDNAGGREEFYRKRQEKTAQVCLDKFGCENYAQSEEFHRKFSNSRRYKYNDELFDSSWELYLWIYALNNNISIKHLPCRFEYYYNDSIHYYFPDFEYDGNLIDIKGPQFISEDGGLKTLYNTDDPERIKAKWQCMLDHNVKLFTLEELKPIMTWVDNKYGKDYIKQYNLKEGGD